MEKLITNMVANIGLNDCLDIAIIAFLIYKILGFIKETRAQQLVKGLGVIVVAFFLSDIFNLYALHWILKSTLTLGVIALVVVFQPELRRALEYVGRSKIVNNPMRLDKDESKEIIDEFVKAVSSFSQSKTGALIIIERETALSDIVETGTLIDAQISAQLLGNIFYEGAPLHDGAVIIRGDRAYAAGCVLPLTSNKNLNKNLGTRHRAGIGITENSDAIAIIVSEETGVISMARDGKLTRFLDARTVEKALLNIYITNEKKDDSLLSKLMGWIGGNDAK